MLTRADDFQHRLLYASGRCGAFGPLCEHRLEHDFGALFAVTIDVPVMGAGRIVTAAGSAFNRERAWLSAFGEAVERLGLFSYSSADVRWASYEELRMDALDPARCFHYGDDVYAADGLGVHRYEPSARGAWYRAHNLTLGRPQYVPAVLVFNEVDEAFPHQARWDRPVSTGGACHADARRAVLTGLYEVIERDALMIHWENALPGWVRRPPPAVESVVAMIEAKGFSVRLVELLSDFGARVALAAIIDERGGRAALGVGAAARASWSAAASRAVEEAFLTSKWISARQATGGRSLAEIIACLEGVPEPVSHADFYGFAENAEKAAFLWQSPPEGAGGRPLPEPATVGTGSVEQELRCLRDQLKRKGFEILVADITPVEGAEAGLCVLRVIVPGLVPLGRGRRLRPLGSARLREVPAAFGLPTRVPSGNPNPHPLP